MGIAHRFLAPSLETQIEQWISDLEAGGWSPHTISSYRTSAEQWVRSGEQPLAFLSSLLEIGRKRSTVNQRRKSLILFCDWRLQRGYIKVNPFGTTRNVREEQRTIPALTKAEAVRLIEGIETMHDENDWGNDGSNLGRWPVSTYRIRLSAMISLQVSSGLRLGELLALKTSDIDLHSRTGMCYGKNSKERPFSFTRSARRYLLRWQDERDRLLPGCEWLFPGSTGKPCSRTAYRRQLENAGWWAGLGKLYPHLLRHTFATWAAEAGTPVLELRDMLGHTNISTTQKYVHEHDRRRAWRALGTRMEEYEDEDPGEEENSAPSPSSLNC